MCTRPCRLRADPACTAPATMSFVLPVQSCGVGWLKLPNEIRFVFSYSPFVSPQCTVLEFHIDGAVLIFKYGRLDCTVLISIANPETRRLPNHRVPDDLGSCCAVLQFLPFPLVMSRSNRLQIYRHYYFKMLNRNNDVRPLSFVRICRWGETKEIWNLDELVPNSYALGIVPSAS